MRLGFHISIAGGFPKVVERAKVRTCDTIQFFSRNPTGWKYGSLKQKEIDEIRTSIQSSSLFPTFLHLNDSKTPLGARKDCHWHIAEGYNGTTENAVKTQIWIAITVCVLVAIVKKQLNLDHSLHSILQVLSVTLFEKTPILRALSNIADIEPNRAIYNQLSLFN